MRGIKFLRAARRTLEGGDDEDARGRLIEAGRSFWSALFEMDDWPPNMVEAANELTRKLLWEGRIDCTVGAMPDAAVARLSQELLDFCKAAEEFSCER